MTRIFLNVTAAVACFWLYAASAQASPMHHDCSRYYGPWQVNLSSGVVLISHFHCRHYPHLPKDDRELAPVFADVFPPIACANRMCALMLRDQFGHTACMNERGHWEITDRRRDE